MVIPQPHTRIQRASQQELPHSGRTSPLLSSSTRVLRHCPVMTSQILINPSCEQLTIIVPSRSNPTPDTGSLSAIRVFRKQLLDDANIAVQNQFGLPVKSKFSLNVNCARRTSSETSRSSLPSFCVVSPFRVGMGVKETSRRNGCRQTACR